MAEEEIKPDNEPDKSAGEDGAQKTFTQEDVNRLIAKEKAKFKNFADYKQKAEKFDELQKSSQTDAQRAEEAEKELAAYKAKEQAAMWAAEVSKDTGVPAELLRGSTKEDIESHAESLKPYFSKPAAPVVDTGKPSEDPESTGDPLRDAINNAL